MQPTKGYVLLRTAVASAVFFFLLLTGLSALTIVERWLRGEATNLPVLWQVVRSYTIRALGVTGFYAAAFAWVTWLLLQFRRDQGGGRR